jgi:hypothetical protein
VVSKIIISMHRKKEENTKKESTEHKYEHSPDTLYDAIGTAFHKSHRQTSYEHPSSDYTVSVW